MIFFTGKKKKEMHLNRFYAKPSLETQGGTTVVFLIHWALSSVWQCTKNHFI